MYSRLPGRVGYLCPQLWREHDPHQSQSAKPAIRTCYYSDSSERRLENTIGDRNGSKLCPETSPADGFRLLTLNLVKGRHIPHPGVTKIPHFCRRVERIGLGFFGGARVPPCLRKRAGGNPRESFFKERRFSSPGLEIRGLWACLCYP